jgi:hypothetical protein
MEFLFAGRDSKKEKNLTEYFQKNKTETEIQRRLNPILEKKLETKFANIQK